jgi:hypothetical protein
MVTKKTKETQTQTEAPKETQTQTEVPTQITTPGLQSHPTDLNVADLKNLALVIDVASSRGAFRANEMATVGLVYNKLQSFLARIAPATPAEGQPASATTEEQK